MIKKVSSFITLMIFSVSCFGPMSAAEAATVTPSQFYARSVIVYDPVYKKVLFSKNAHKKRPPASTTKVLTALVVLDKLKLNDVITVGVDTSHVPRTKAYVRPGEKFRVRDLLKALLISSSNDVAVVFAHHISGSTSKFSKLMNAKARKIGSRNTNFVNPNGLPADRQYSTTYDLALIMNEAKKYPFVMQTLATKRATIKSRQGKTFHLKNHNKMLWKDSRPIIGKTGFTRRALHCFVGRINYKERDVLIAIMGSIRPWHDLKVLLDFYSSIRASIKKKGSSQNSAITNNQKAWSRRRMQKIEAGLKRAGFYPGRVDGKVTGLTIKAVKRFQAKNGIPQTGFVGPLTSKALEKHLK